MEILEDPAFGVPGRAGEVEARWEEVEVASGEGTVDIESTEPPRFAIAAGTRSSWVSQEWNILGVTYTEIRTTIRFSYVEDRTGARVSSVNACYGSYTNYVPLRSIDHSSWHTQYAREAACRTEWTLGRFGQDTVRGIAGLRVNGYGTIVQRWNV